MSKAEAEVTALKDKVASLQKQVDRYAMLPHDERAAKKEVDKLAVELERLRRIRDSIWEEMTK